MQTRRFRLAAFLAASLVLSGAASAEPDSVPLKQLLQDASSWAFQLQGTRPADLDKTAYDVIVLDAFFGGGPEGVARLRHKAYGSGRRLVLAYLSVGEAEVYRYYWQRCCAGGRRPAWIGPEDKRWPGNFRVRFWDQEWKDIVFDDEQSYLKLIIDAGFDGVYLDRIDVWREISGPGIAPRTEMVAFVRALAAKARSLKPGFLVVAQNAEDLVAEPPYLAAIDAIAKEDLFNGPGGQRNDAKAIATSLALLDRAQAAGKPVMVVEYVQDPAAMERTRTEIMEHGFVPTFAPRSLQRLQVDSQENDDSH